jgi:hypothetical protein
VLRRHLPVLHAAACITDTATVTGTFCTLTTTHMSYQAAGAAQASPSAARRCLHHRHSNHTSSRMHINHHSHLVSGSRCCAGISQCCTPLLASQTQQPYQWPNAHQPPLTFGVRQQVLRRHLPEVLHITAYITDNATITGPSTTHIGWVSGSRCCAGILEVLHIAACITDKATIPVAVCTSFTTHMSCQAAGAVQASPESAAYSCRSSASQTTQP